MMGGGGRGGGGSKGGGLKRIDGDRKLPAYPRGDYDDNHRDGGSFSDKQSHENREDTDVDENEENLTTKNIRIYVGGLGEGVTRDDLCGTFSKMGVEIEAVDIIRTKGRSFAYIDFSHHSSDSLSKLFNTYNGCVWKGGRLRLEKAKEDYLVRLKQEWDEDAQSARSTSVTNVDVNANSTELAEKFKKGITAEKKQLRLFFPKLRKVKSLPFTGTGKHKYSFRRVEVPPLPTYFCDCEEHCGSLYNVEEKQIPRVEDQGGGMNKNEIELMNSVMHKLFEKENVSNAACNDVKLTKEEEEDNADEEIDEMQLDEIEDSDDDDDDDVIINVVSRRKETTRPYQDSKPNKRQASYDGPAHLALEKKTRHDEENKENKSLPRDEGNLQAGSEITPGAKNTEQKSSGSSFSWSQKSSWKELIGNKSNISITISDILPSAPSKKNQQQKSSNSTNSTDSKTKKSQKHENQRDKSDQKAEDSTDAHHMEMDPIFEKGQIDENKKYHSDEKMNGSADAQPTEIDSSEKGIRGENKNSPMLDYQIDQLDEKVQDTENPENKKDHQFNEMAAGLAEAQPNKSESAPEKGGGRGSAWLHKSSWTQLVTSNTSATFSLTQIIPGLAFDPKNPNGALTANSRGNACDEVIEKTGTDRDVPSSTQPKPLCSADNHDFSAPTASKPFLTSNVAGAETFSFKRSDESLKEWAQIKAALSRSQKRTNKKK